MNEPQSILFPESGAIPNNPRLPVLVYAKCFDASGDGAAAIERLFAKNGWPPEWRDGIFDFHHYHSTAHEALGIAKGEATVILGGPHGKEFILSAGDIVVLPAGTGHRRISKLGGLLVVGAYPRGQSWDLIREEPEKKAAAMKRIAELPLPESDPVLGVDGPLVRMWRSGAKEMGAN
jgi:uncharacterized protein YjlB